MTNPKVTRAMIYSSIKELRQEISDKIRLFSVSLVCLFFSYELAEYDPEEYTAIWVAAMAVLVGNFALSSAISASRKSRSLRLCKNLLKVTK